MDYNVIGSSGHRVIGSSDLIVSAVGLTWMGDLYDQPHAALGAAIDAGITYFDVVLVYEECNERLLADVLKGHRDDFVVAASIGWSDEEDDFAPGSREDVRQIELALERLDTDHIDSLDRPPSDYRYWVRQRSGPQLEDTLESMHELVEEGKARALALACVSADQLGERDQLARTAPRSPSSRSRVSTTPSPQGPDRAVQPVASGCRTRGDSVLRPARDRLFLGRSSRLRSPHRPVPAWLASLNIGIRRITDETFDLIERLERFAEERVASSPSSLSPRW